MRNYRNIDMEKYPRIDHFRYFSGFAIPYGGVTADVDITEFMNTLRERELPFFLSFFYCVIRAANDVPELRQRITGEKRDKIVEYEYCDAGYTVALPDSTYCYCILGCDKPFDEFLPYAQEEQRKAVENPSIEDGDYRAEMFFISSVPWISYNDVFQPLPHPADSTPRIVWGKYREENGKYVIPVTILCNHALVDGIHIARFFEGIERHLSDIEA